MRIQKRVIKTDVYKRQVLINTGGREESRMVLQTLKEQQISRIDLLVLSSFSESAMGGAARIIENLEIGAVALKKIKFDKL